MPTALQAKLLHVIEAQSVRPVGGDARGRRRRAHRRCHQPQPGRRRQARGSSARICSTGWTWWRWRCRRCATGARICRSWRRTSSPRCARRYPASPVERLGSEALAVLGRHAWPGNVRELSHVLERIVLLGRNARDRRRRSAAGGARSGRRRPAGVPRRDPPHPRAAAALRRLGAHPGGRPPRPRRREAGDRREDAAKLAGVTAGVMVGLTARY